jgi:hypothetical protein
LPAVLCLRENIFEERIEVGHADIAGLTGDTLNRWAHECRNLYKRDLNVLIKYRNLVARAHGIYHEEE